MKMLKTTATALLSAVLGYVVGMRYHPSASTKYEQTAACYVPFSKERKVYAEPGVIASVGSLKVYSASVQEAFDEMTKALSSQGKKLTDDEAKSLRDRIQKEFVQTMMLEYAAHIDGAATSREVSDAFKKAMIKHFFTKIEQGVKDDALQQKFNAEEARYKAMDQALIHIVVCDHEDKAKRIVESKSPLKGLAELKDRFKEMKLVLSLLKNRPDSKELIETVSAMKPGEFHLMPMGKNFLVIQMIARGAPDFDALRDHLKGVVIVDALKEKLRKAPLIMYKDAKPDEHLSEETKKQLLI